MLGEFLTNNLGTIIVATAVVALMGVLLYSLIRYKKAGKSSCGGGCSGCPMSGKCHTQSKEKQDE